MNLLLTKPSKTGKAIARELGIPYSIRGSYHSVDTLIRWGTTVVVDQRANKVLNSIEAIRKSSDKMGFIQLLRDNNIPTVKIGDSVPCIGRPRFHQRGRGFFYCEDNYDIRRARRKGAEYFTEFYPKTKEYRIHIAGGKVLLFSEKLLTDQSRRLQRHVWNAKNGYTFKHLYRHMWLEDDDLMDMQLSCKDAMEKLGLDFGAFDVLYSPYLDNRYAIIEVNTAPSLSPLALEKYLEYFKNEMKDTAEYI